MNGRKPPKPESFASVMRDLDAGAPERRGDAEEDESRGVAEEDESRAVTSEANAPLRLPPRRFVRDDAAGRGRAEDVPEKVLRQLRRGQPEADHELDLHGLDAREAEQRVQSALLDAHRDGTRCVRVIHGRGRHRGPAVLRAALPGWLCATELAGIVQAFARSPVERDGGGSTLVLLRRPARRS